MSKMPTANAIAQEGLGLSTTREATLVLTEEPANEGEVDIWETNFSEVIEGDYENGNNDVDQLIQVVHALDGVSHQLVLANNQGSISAATATALQAAVEHLTRSAGLPTPAVFCVENYGGILARRQATSVALESIAGVIKAVTNKIIKWLKAVMNFVREVMQELINGADMVAARARAVKERAKAIAHLSIGKNKDTLSSSSLARYFSEGGVVVPADKLTAAYKKITALMGANYPAFIRQTSQGVSSAIQAAKKGDTEEQAVIKCDKLINGLKSSAFSQFKSLTNGSSADVMGFNLPFGQRSILVSFTKNEGYYTGLNVLMDDTLGADKIKTKGKLATLNYTQIMEAAGAVEHEMLFGLFKDYRAVQSDLNRIEKEVNRGCDEITRAQQSGSSSSVPYSVHFLKDLVASVISMTVVIHRYDIILARSMLEYCSRSIKSHA